MLIGKMFDSLQDMLASQTTMVAASLFKQHPQNVFFMKQILQFPGSMVGNMYIKKKQGNKVWIDKLKVTAEELLTLDMDDDVKQWIQDKSIKYNDHDW